MGLANVVSVEAKKDATEYVAYIFQKHHYECEGWGSDAESEIYFLEQAKQILLGAACLSPFEYAKRQVAELSTARKREVIHYLLGMVEVEEYQEQAEREARKAKEAPEPTATA